MDEMITTLLTEGIFDADFNNPSPLHSRVDEAFDIILTLGMLVSSHSYYLPTRFSSR